MNAERFEDLALAYGGDLRRWPAAERAAAEAFVAADRHASERMLFAARQIDAALDALTCPAPSPELRARILASAPRPRVRPRARGWWFWAPGAGLAAACAAGVIFGAVATAHVADDAQADVVIAANAETVSGDFVAGAAETDAL